MKESASERNSKNGDDKGKPLRYEDGNFIDTERAVWNYSLLYDDDIETFHAGTHYSLYKKFGSKPVKVLGKKGFHFSVWAPNATSVSVIANFNNWKPGVHQLTPRWDKSGVWEGFIPGVVKGDLYKYRITGYKGLITEKGDPFANYWQKRPDTSSIAWEFDYKWNDKAWMKKTQAA